MTNRQLVFPYGIWRQCLEALFAPTGEEGFALGLARPCSRDGGLAYVVEHLVDPSSIVYENRSGGGLTLSSEASNRLNAVSAGAARLGLVPVHLHSHPAGVDTFSGYDDLHELRLHRWLRDQCQPFLWSLVNPYVGEPVARFWHNDVAHPGVVRVGLRPYALLDGGAAPALDRQRAFGPGLRLAAETLLVGIVGLGGVGLPAAEQLARSGFRRFVLVDPDRVEESNLNRLTGATRADVGQPKVRVARRLIRQAAHSVGATAQVSIRDHDLYLSGPARTALKRCDLILALTDNHLSRISCLQIALEGGAEYLQAGVDVRLDSDGSIAGLFVEVTGAEIMRYCPLCTSRLDPDEASIEARRYVGGEVWDRAKKEGYVPGVIAPSVMSLNAIAAGHLVMEIQRRVSGLGVRDLFRLDVQTARVESFENIETHLVGGCQVCSRLDHTSHTSGREQPPTRGAKRKGRRGGMGRNRADVARRDHGPADLDSGCPEVPDNYGHSVITKCGTRSVPRTFG